MKTCDLCKKEIQVRWDPERKRWICDECKAHYFCVECQKGVVPEDVFEDVPFGLYLAVICKECAEKQGKNVNTN